MRQDKAIRKGEVKFLFFILRKFLDTEPVPLWRRAI